ncbi:MAG: putative metal-dependent hydrolase [halophilic archaeon J07HX5]|jgi:Predicted metal-dependent hydrolase of the TIM-barrel fold|nr:MAG: putative metal-dependent hydrolase [halophilic archaeon J07HX5]
MTTSDTDPTRTPGGNTTGNGDTDTGFRPAIDAHTHVFPEKLMAAIRAAISAEAGWSFDNPVTRPAIETTLREAGVLRYVALPYVTEPGAAAELNSWLLEQAAESDRLVPFATVHPDDDAPGAIARRAFERGARGLKFHCPVQGCSPADPGIAPALEAAAAADRPVTYHGGTAPMFEDSPHVGVEPFSEVIASYPKLRVCCAHMGTYDTDAFLSLARTHEQVYLDTTFAMSTQATETMGFDPASIADETLIELSGSIMYGSDFPNIPYRYREERAGLLDRELPETVVRDLFFETAQEYLRLDLSPASGPGETALDAGD